MASWRHTLAVANRRVAAQAAVSGAVRMVPAATVVGLVCVGIATARGQAPNWLVIGVAMGGAVAVAALMGFMRRPSGLSTAVAIDRHAGLNDAISTAVQLSAKPELSAFERQAVVDADAAAASADPRMVFPWRLSRSAGLVAAAAAVIAASALVPVGWPAKAMQLAGLKKAPPKAEIQTALADAKAAEQLIRAVTPPGAQPSSPDAPGDMAQRADPLGDLRKQLEQGQVSPKDATQQAATAIERAADRLEQKALDAQAAQDLLRDRLALAQKAREDAAQEQGASDFTRAMKSGDLEKAAAEAERLASAAENLSAKEKAQLADELKQLAQSLKQPAERPAQPPTEKPRPAPADQSNVDQTPPADGKSRPDEPPPEPPAQQQADQQARDLVDKLQKASDELKKREKQPPGEQQKGSNSQSDQRQAGKPEGERSKSDQSSQDQTARPPQPPNSGEQNKRESKPDQEHGQQPLQQQNSEQQQGQPKPGEGQQQGANQPGEKPQGDKPQPDSKPQPESKSQPDGKPQPADQPQPSGQQKTGEKPQQPQSNEGAQQQSQQQAGEQQKSPPQGNPRQQGEQPAGARPQDAQNQAPQPQQSPQSNDGARPKQGDQQSTQPQADQQQRGDPKAGEQPDAKPQPGDGSEPAKLPDKLPSLDQLRDKLKDLADQRRQSQQDRQDAQKLREQAQKLWENATPEQRKQMEQLARELAQRNAGKQPPGGQPEPRGSAGESEQAGKPQEPGGMAGASDQPDSPDGRGPGNGPAGDKPKAPVTANAPTTTHDLDARSRGEGEAPSRVIAEWLTNKPSPRTGQPGNASAAPADVARAVDQSRQNAEQAVQQRTVPARLTPLIRRYFDRLPQAVGAGGTQPQPGPAPSPAPAPSAKP